MFPPEPLPHDDTYKHTHTLDRSSRPPHQIPHSGHAAKNFPLNRSGRVRVHLEGHLRPDRRCVQSSSVLDSTIKELLGSGDELSDSEIGTEGMDEDAYLAEIEKQLAD